MEREGEENTNEEMDKSSRDEGPRANTKESAYEQGICIPPLADSPIADTKESEVEDECMSDITPRYNGAEEDCSYAII